MAITKYFSLKMLIFAPKFMFHSKNIKIMTTNEMILQAQITSLRRVADVLLLHFWSDAENKTQLIWFLLLKLQIRERHSRFFRFRANRFRTAA